jgi:hypothetical protein
MFVRFASFEAGFAKSFDVDCPVLTLPSDFLRCRPEATAGLHLSIFDDVFYHTLFNC